MTSEYTLIWSFRNRIAELKDSVESADKYTSKDMKFLLIDANSDYYNIKWIHDICNNIKEREIRICETHYRTTLPEAWNLGMMLSDTRYCIFASSDVTFHRYSWYIRLIGKYDYVLMPNHAVFALDKAIIPKIGWFDEKFKNGPHFDCDYMIRASEANIPVLSIENENFYHHQDQPEVTKARLSSEMRDRLPMNDLYNEKYFKLKWKSNWPGWENAADPLNLPHPPTNIHQVKRCLAEVDPHRMYTDRFSLLYNKD